VPVLGLGVSAAIVAADAGIGKADVRREPALTRVTTTPDAGDDPLAGAMPDEILWFTDVRVSWEVSAGATVLARDPAGTPVYWRARPRMPSRCGPISMGTRSSRCLVRTR
jgi:hypothetical protein